MPPAVDPSQWWQYGAVGALAGTLLGLFVWMMVTLFKRLLVHLDQLQLFFGSCTKALENLTSGQVELARRTDDITVKLNDIAARRRGF